MYQILTFNIPDGKVYIGTRAPVSIDTSTIPAGTVGYIGIQELDNGIIRHDSTALYTSMETNVPLPNVNKKLLSLNGSEQFTSYVNCHLIVNLNKTNLQSNLIIKY